MRDVSLDVPGHGALAIVGPSGSGKTTLLKLLAGFLVPQQGSLTILQQPIKRHVPRSLRKRLGYIPQQLGLVRSLTAMENVLMGALSRGNPLMGMLGIFPAAEQEEALRLLSRLGIEDKAGEKVYRLSGGQRQRVAIARTLLQRPAIVLADEFVSDLDQPRAIEVLEMMRDIGREQGLTFVYTMHEPDLVHRFATRVVTMAAGRIESVADVTKPAQPKAVTGA